MICTVGGREF